MFTKINMFEKQFQMVKPKTVETDESEGKKRQEMIEGAKGFNEQIKEIQAGRSLDDLNVLELKQVLGLYREISNIGKDKEGAREGKMEGTIIEQIRTAREIMGEKEVMGPEQIEKAFGIKLRTEEVPAIPFSKFELKRAKDLGQFLVLRTGKASDGKPLTMEKMNEKLSSKFEKDKKGKILYSVDWYKEQAFYTGETEKKPADYSTPNLEWALTTKELIPNSTDKNYLQQTEEIATYLETKTFKDKTLPVEYKEAIDELNAKKSQLQKLLSEGDRSKYEPEISKLKINKLVRQNPSEVLYDILIYFQNNGERLLENNYTWTHATASDGFCVFLGRFGSGGLDVDGSSADYSDSGLGVVFSRKF